MSWFCFRLSGFVLHHRGFALPTRTRRAFTRSFLRATSLSAAEKFEYVCECNMRFEMENILQSHISKSGHFDGKFDKEVRKKCKQAVVQVTAPLIQKAVPAAIVKPKYICECKEHFADVKALQSHISKSGHFGGMFNKEVANKCNQAVVGMTSPLAQKASRPANQKFQSVDANELRSHIATSGHYGGQYNADVLNKCKISGSFASTKAIKLSQEGIRMYDVEDSPTRAKETKAHVRLERLQKLNAYISGSDLANSQSGNALADAEHVAIFKESALLGTLIGSSMHDENQSSGAKTQQRVYLNTHEPFCLVTVGVQGGGKSHTLATVLEGCLIPFPEHNLSRLQEPMTTLVLHYDESASTRCEVSLLRFVSA